MNRKTEHARNRLGLRVGSAIVVGLLALACNQAQPVAPAKQVTASTAPAAQAPTGGTFCPEGGEQAQYCGPGAATLLLRQMGIPRGDFGVKVKATFDASGPAAYEAKPGDLLYFTNGMATGKPGAEKYKVVVIDAKTKKTRASTDFDFGTPGQDHGIGLSPDAKWVYMPNVKDKTLAILDAKTLKPAKFLDLGFSPHHPKLLTDKLVMIDTMGTGPGSLAVLVLDPAKDNAVVGGVPRGDFPGRTNLAFPSPDSSYLYMMGFVQPRRNTQTDEYMDGLLMRVNTSTWESEGFTSLGGWPIWSVFSRDGKYAWVTIGRDSKVQKIDTATMKVIADIPVGTGPFGAFLSPDGNSLYVADKGEPRGGKGMTISVVDTRSNTIVNTVATKGMLTDHVIVSPDGTELWATHNSTGNITVLSLPSLEIKAEIDLPGKANPHGGVWVQYDRAGVGHVVMDQAGPHSGVSPYTFDQQHGIPSLAQALDAKDWPSVDVQQALAPAQQRAPAAVQAPVAARQAIEILEVGNTFRPSEITVAPGAAIRFSFRNNDSEDHNLVSGQVPFPPNQQSPGGTSTLDWVAPQQPGTYEAYCAFHGTAMAMKIVVK